MSRPFLGNGFLPTTAAAVSSGAFGAGTVAAPSITVGDSGTGIYRPAENQIAWSLNGVEAMRLGGEGPDTNQTLALGRCLLDSRVTDRLCLSHRDHTGTNAYALSQTTAGTTFLNCPAGQSVQLTYANTTRLTVGATGISFFAAAQAAQQSIAGSRGGNAALADLLTKLALYGLIVDGTSA